MIPDRDAVIAAALAHGFDAAGIVAPEGALPAGGRLRQFLALGRHGCMDWLETHAERRSDPRALMPTVRSIVMLGLNYGPQGDPLAALGARDRGNISVYARGRDYHDVVKRRLKAFGRWLHQASGMALKVFVDTAPVLEKPLAAAAGLGWQGKHSNLVSREFGSWLFLGAVFTELTLAPDTAEGDHCGTCRACLDICPTAAFPAPYQLDARRCISYLTIEHKGVIPAEFRVAIGNRIYGCDDCLAVCPWNKWASLARETALHARPALDLPLLVDLAALDDAGFRALFTGSPIKRTGRDRFVRNVTIALGNSGDPVVAAVVEPLLDDGSPLVRAMAVWALSRLAGPSRIESLIEARLAAETDADVRAEWRAAQSIKDCQIVSNSA